MLPKEVLICQESKVVKPTSTSKPTNVSWQQDISIGHLPRAEDVFNKICLDDSLSCQLPPSGSNAGRVLQHAIAAFEKSYLQNQPMIFKFGITHDPHFRWHNDIYGYKHGSEKFSHMVVLFAADNPEGPAFLEAALIDHFKGTLAAYLVHFIVF